MPWIPLGGPGSTWQPYGGGSAPPGGSQGSISGRGSISESVPDPLAAAIKRTFPTSQGGSYFPAAQQMFAGNDRTDLLKDIDNTFYGGGQAQPTPTPTPTAVKPHQMNLAQLYDHFGVDQPTPQSYFPAANKQMHDWESQYGWS